MKTSIASLVALICLVSFGSSAHAGEKWKKKHPRRAEVNQRLQNQQNRVDQGLSSDKLNDQQARRIQNQDSRIRAEEQRDASRDGGHITKVEQRRMNRQENRVSREIRRDERKDAQPAQPAQPVSAPTAGQ